MKDKEKQIEEMAKLIKDYCIIDASYGGKLYANDYENLASILLEHYQPKLPEDSVVLSREEYEKLTTPRLFIQPRELNQNEFAEKLKNAKYGIIGVDESSIEIIPTRQEIEKETAEKILKDLWAEFEKPVFWADNVAEGIKELAKQFGIEIKE